VWIASAVGAVVLGWLASREMPLWPDRWHVPGVGWLVAGSALYLPYVWLRSVRLRFLLDPIVSDARGGKRLDPRLLHGSGFVSFFVIMALPLRLGEFSRPLLLARGRAPGVRVAEAMSAVAAERVLDGLAVVGMLFLGLAIAPPEAVASLPRVQAVGHATAIVMIGGLAILVIASRAPERLDRIVQRVVPGTIGQRLGAFSGRVAHALEPAWRPRVVAPLLGATIVYWLVTVVQLQWVAQSCGVELDLASSAVVVSVVGLSIQLPGGPAQLGSFQLGVALALGLYLDPATHPGAVSFGVALYTLELAGAAIFSLPGAWLMRRATRDVPSAPAP
jgi:uncharacterized membrane protein YbhN (UPF0104 family)